MFPTQVCCQYDGSFTGFLSCVFDCYVHQEEPVEFRTPGDPCCSLYPMRTIPAHEEHAKRVYRSLAQRLGAQGQRMVARGFLTCLPDKELWLWRLSQEGYQRGPAFTRDLTHPVVDRVGKAVLHLEHEAHLFTGFVRFSDLAGTLVGEIEPKTGYFPCCAPTSAPATPRSALSSMTAPTRRHSSTSPASGPFSRWRIFRWGPLGKRSYPTAACGALFTTPLPSRPGTTPRPAGPTCPCGTGGP